MTGAVTWRGRRGAVLLGPTEDRVARYLADMTRRGRVTIRTVDLVARLNLERSEVYRITARLRVLGLFGVENDQGGTNGGRRYWRTGIEHDGARLDAARHRAAWGRILAWARARREVVAARLGELHTPRSVTRPVPARIGSEGSAGLVSPPVTVQPAGPSFRELFAGAGGGALLEAWGR